MFGNKKTKFLKEIGKEFSQRKASALDAENIKDYLSSSNEDSIRHDKALSKLLSFCLNDPELSETLERLNHTGESLREIFDFLNLQGAGVLEGGHWVSASSIATAETLEFVTETILTEEFGGMKIAAICINYWEGKELPHYAGLRDSDENK